MAAKKSSPLKIIPLGGLDGIGKNMTVFECGDDMVLVDAGLMFPDDSQPGIDLVLPDYTYVLENEEKLRGIVVTHGHEDHTGSLPYLLQDLNNKVPIISSKLTLGFIECKLSEFRIRAPKFREVKGGSHVNLGGISLDFFSMTHSIPGALGVFIRTNQGTVMHTGDFKLDQTPIDGVTPDYAAISRFAKQGIDLLLSDSTNATVPGFTKSEAEVGPNLLHAIKNAPGRVFVASFSSHIHRLQQICDAARKCGRKVVVTGRSMLTNTRVARELGYLNIDDADIIDAFDIDNLPDDKIVVMCTGSQGEPMAALGRIADGNHRDITINEFDTVILASSLIPGNEHGVYKVINKLVQLGARVVNRDNAAVHVSGHCNEGELLYMYNIVKPKCAMPIHGENRHLVANGLIAVKTGVDPKNVVLAEDGDVVDLYHGQAAVVGSVPCGYVYVDGDSVGEITDEELEKRRILGTEGFVSSFVVVDTEASEVVTGPKIFLNAVAEDESEFDKIRHQIVEQLQDAMMQGTKDTHRLQQIMRRTLGGWIARQLHRKPMIVPVVADIAQDIIEEPSK